MGLLDDAIREHLELKRRRGADVGEIAQEEQEALGPARRGPAPLELPSDAEESAPVEDGLHSGDPLAESGHGAEDVEDPYEEGDWHDPDRAESYPAAASGPETGRHDPEPSGPRADDVSPVETSLPDPASPGFAESDHLAAPTQPFSALEPQLSEGPHLVPPDAEGHLDSGSAPGASAEPIMPAVQPDSEAPADHPDPPPAGHQDPEAPAGHSGSGSASGHPEAAPPAGPGAAQAPAPDPASAPTHQPDDVLEETPEFLQETPEHDRLWFEQRPPRDFDFDK